ncbi:hypothetical protein LVD15_12485 [Fulvivirga maritima]|uniref:hypothetical protein n=1 Tax=Fulvivirga maritima TaxID=2904247 RepID=UPI001F47F4AC|nr:hypothetical protein [Fulvivirga maritima]UII29203.1 hypothetical protein LVD15_12485 [Fulvivirga maritima]
MTYYILLDQLFNIQPSTKQVDQWTKARRLEDIEYFLENGDYKVRIACAKALVVLDAKSSIERLRNQLSDKVKPVAQECANSLRKLGASSEVEREIEEMEARWKERSHLGRE